MAPDRKRTGLHAEAFDEEAFMISVDTNLLFAWLNSAHPAHAPASRWFETLSDSRELVICELVLVELYGLLRNEVIVQRPLSANAATEVIQNLRRHPTWDLIDYPGGLMESVWSRTGERNFGRRKIYDTRLALTLRHYGVDQFATQNTKDFQGFGFAKVWDPSSGT